MDRKTGQTLSESKFNACIPLQPKRTDLAENGKEYLKTVQALFDTATGKLTEEPAQGNETLTPENAYLHIQGHQLYKLLAAHRDPAVQRSRHCVQDRHS